MRKQGRLSWDQRSAVAKSNQLKAFDVQRNKCPVINSDLMGISVLSHNDVVQILHDHETYSNAVSQHLSVPNGMDPPEHSEYRQIIEKYFTDDSMKNYENLCRDLAVKLIEQVLKRDTIEFISDFALPFATQNQCAFLHWSARLRNILLRWTLRSQEAIRNQDRSDISAIAREFEELIDGLLEDRKKESKHSDNDILASLMNEKVWGRTLSNEEISSILRNWTVGEIGTISASVGILAHFLAENNDIQNQLRDEPSSLFKAIDEILRIHGPLLANRRITTKPVKISGQEFEPEERISLIWISANRDPKVFDNPDQFRLDRNSSDNLLFGAGIHVCPGAPLARLELRVFMEEFLKRTKNITLVTDSPPVHAIYPASGYAILPLMVY